MDEPQPPQFLRNISSNSNSSFSQDLKEYLDCKNLDFCHLSSSDDGAIATDFNATSRSPQIENYPGNFNFNVALPADICRNLQDVPAKADCTYSDSLDKIFIKRNTGCLFTFKLNKMSTNLQVRLILLFENSSQRENTVMRCMHHQTTEHLKSPEHIVRCESSDVVYDYNTETGRFSTLVSLEDNVTEVSHGISFACLSTCPGGINRRNVLLCCTLERKQRVIGRRTFKLKISTCPGRERKTEENKLTENRQNNNVPGANSKPNSLKRRVPFGESEEVLQSPMGNPSTDEFYSVNITLRNPHLIQYALMTKCLLENADRSDSIPADFVFNPVIRRAMRSSESGSITPPASVDYQTPYTDL